MVHCARHHPLAPIRAATALQRTSRNSRSLLLEPLSQSAAFESPKALALGTGYHPGSHRPSRVSDYRFVLGHVGSRVLSLSSCSLYDRVSTQGTFRARARFQRVGTRKPRLQTSEKNLPVRLRLQVRSPASPFGPLVVELFAVRDLLGTPRPIWSRSDVSPRPNSPRWPRLNEPDGPNPRVWICTTSIIAAIPRRGESGISASPRSRGSMDALSDRTQGFVSRFPRGVRPVSLRRTGRATLVASGSTGAALLGR